MWMPIRCWKLERRIYSSVRKFVTASMPLPAPTWKSAPLQFLHPSFPLSRLEESVSRESPSYGLSRPQNYSDLIPSDLQIEFAILRMQFPDQRTKTIESAIYAPGEGRPAGDIEWKLANQENNTEEKLYHFFARFSGRELPKKIA